MSMKRKPHLLRQLGALFYDWLLLAAVLFFALIPLAAAVNFLGVDRHSPGYELASLLYLLGIVNLYFIWQWRHGGQTVGLRAWHLRLVDETGHPPSWRACSLRAGVAAVSALCLGLGYLWALWDANGRSWHDRLSATRLVRV